MKYAMLIYLDSNRWSALSKDERNQIHEDCGAWHDELVKSGKSHGALGLEAVTTATTISAGADGFAIMDGPFAETKEVLGGLEQVECSSLDEAIAIAKRFPALRAGSKVEVRPMVNGACRD